MELAMEDGIMRMNSGYYFIAVKDPARGDYWVWQTMWGHGDVWAGLRSLAIAREDYKHKPGCFIRLMLTSRKNECPEENDLVFPSDPRLKPCSDNDPF